MKAEVLEENAPRDNYAGNLRSRDLSSIAWSIATMSQLRIRHRRYVQEVVDNVRSVGNLGGQDIANILWACCKTDVSPPRLGRITVGSL